MNLIHIDLETKSEIDLPLCGAYKYTHHKSFDILMMGYSVNWGPVKLWLPPQPFPFPTWGSFKVVGHNIGMFDMPGFNAVRKKYGIERLHSVQVIDTMAIAGRFSLPQHLNDLAKALGLKIQKHYDGMKLIRMFCIPPFRRPVGPLWEKFKSYCKQDVRVLQKVHKALPATDLNASERKIWQSTLTMNNTGVPVDYPAIAKIYSGLDKAKKYQLSKVPEITNGEVQRITEIAKIKKFVIKHGVELKKNENGNDILDAHAVEEILNDPNTPKPVQQILDLRATHGRSSVAKYQAMLLRAYKRRVFDGLRYYGAAPGRFSGLGTQWQNFPRNLPDPATIESTIELFSNEYDVERDPEAILKAKAILRGMIKAPEGREIFTGDYSSIEYIALCWWADELEAIDRFRRGRDQYKEMASFILKKPYDDVTKEERQFGKPIILGRGYLLGENGLVRYAKQYGVTMEPSESAKAIAIWDERYKKTKKLWRRVYNAAVNAVNSGSTTATSKCVFNLVHDRNSNKWLAVKLPSGRTMYYFKPWLEEGKYGWEIRHYGFIPGTSRKWGKVWLTAPRLIENIDQGMCRDILCEHILRLQKAQYKVITTIHDEILLEMDEMQSVNPVIAMMTCPPKWCHNLPIRISWTKEKRYAKT